MKTELIYQNKFFYSKGIHSLSFRYRRLVMSAFMLVSDSLAISGSILISIALWRQVRPDLQVNAHLSLIIPAIILFAFIYQLVALYPAIGLGPVEELKRLTISTSFVMLALVAISFFLRNITTFSRAALIISWLLIVVSSPLSRKVFRRLAVKLGLWGIPTMLAGNKKSVVQFHKHLIQHPLTGFWPVLCMSGPIQNIFPIENENALLFSHIHTVIIADDRGEFGAVRHLITQRKYRFKHIIVLFDEAKIGPIWFTPLAIMEHMGLEVAHNLLDPTQQFIKRMIEIILIILALPIIGVLFTIIAIAIKSTSRGPVFYKQERVGSEGKELWIWKFRTMVYNADVTLQEYLSSNPTLQQEWKESFKLKNDPRITRIGKSLRRTSLDELPQIWNVLRGEMSLIGPRPIVDEEIALYGEEFQIYKQVLPGLTGMWQISGRNNLTYRERVNLDVYYVQNWSIWLDIHILLHSVITVFEGKGAY